PPPTHTRSPYTTLFRSREEQQRLHAIGRPGRELEGHTPAHRVSDDGGFFDLDGLEELAHRPRVVARRVVGAWFLGLTVAGKVGEDRKSTRLNSSHQIIS